MTAHIRQCHIEENNVRASSDHFLNPGFPGMSLEYTRMASGAMVAKLNQERSVGVDGAEVAILTDRGWLEERVKDGSLAPPAGPNAAGWPKTSMLSGIIPVLSLETMAIVYNPNLVKTPINGYADLFRPELKGKITTEELVAPVIVAWYEWVEKTMRANYFTRLAELQPGIYGSATAGVQSVAAGEFAVATVINSGLAVPLAKQGLPLRVVNPTPDRAGFPRYSLPFFQHFVSDFPIATLPCLNSTINAAPMNAATPNALSGRRTFSAT